MDKTIKKMHFIFIIDYIENIKQYICILITFINSLKVFFRIRNVYYNPNAPDTNCKSIFLMKKTSSGFLKIIGVQI